MSKLNPDEREEIHKKIFSLKDQIYDIRSYISSDFCKRCSDMYTKILVLEQQIKSLQSKLDNDKEN